MPSQRGQWPSPAARCVITRTRAEMFLHRTRSGLARSDPARARPDSALRHRLPSSISPTPLSGDAPMLTTIRDLRSRRVFSSPSVAAARCSPDPIDKIGADASELYEIDRLEKEGREEQRNGGEVIEISKGFDALDDGLFQSTPPDSAGVAGFHSDIGTGMTKAEVKSCSSIPPRNRLGLNPCSRLKLFRNPSSFSYRRLLPFLKDLAKDSSSGVEILPSENYYVHAEKLEERYLQQQADTPSNQQPQLGGSGVPLAVESSKKLGLVENPVCEIPIFIPSKDDVHCSETTTLQSESCNTRAFQVEPKTLLKDSIFEFELLATPNYFAPTAHWDLSVEELAGNVQALSYPPRKIESGGCSVAAPALDMDENPTTGTSKLGAVHSLGQQTLAPRKGILKRHGRGCKGFCMCLDCVSFRIHADRAYEFSRKQMQEADEIIEGLMKELVGLRSLVDKSIVPMAGNGCPTILQFNQELLKGACQRASRAEEVADKRRKQMFIDLNRHCRIPGPKVTFADYVEERNIP